MRILHAAEDIAGISGTLAQYQRSQGHDVTTLCYHPSEFQYPSDISFPEWPRLSGVEKLARMLNASRELIPRVDVLHLTGGRTLLPYMVDLPLARKLGKTVIVHFHGCEIRQTARSAGRPGVHCYECELRPKCDIGKQLGRLRMAKEFADAILCSTPDLLAAVPEAIYLPNPIDVDLWESYSLPPLTRPRPFRVMHRPTSPELKGTVHVLKAVEGLIREGLPIELRSSTSLIPHDLMFAEYQRADLMVEQLYMGWYGVAAVEAMAMGKPVMAWLRPTLREKFGDPPVIQADRYTIQTRIRETFESDDCTALASAAGLDYVHQVHDARKIGARVMQIYRDVGHG